MKKQLLFLALLLVGNLAFSQAVFRIVEATGGNPIVNDGAIFHSAVVGGNTTSKTFSMTNLTASTLTLSVRKFEDLLNTVAMGDVASPYFCTGLICYPASTFNSTVSLAPNESLAFIAYIDEATVAGNSKVRYRFTNGVSSQSITFTMDYNNPTVGINEKNSPVSSLSLYPNPTNGEKLNVNFNTNELIPALQIVITSITGQEVLKTNINPTLGNNNMEINLSNLINGIYFIKLDGINNSAQKLIINK